MHECNETKGESFSAFGTDLKLFNSKGKFNQKAFADKVIGNWVEYEIDVEQ